MNIDVIIPTFNEEGWIGKQLQAVCNTTGVRNVIVVDGGSSDQTLDQIKAFPQVQCKQVSASRGHQQCHGARKATSDILLFLHADVSLPEGWTSLVMQTMQAKNVVAGAFQIQTIADPKCKSWADRLLFLADIRSRYSNRPYGDQCIFVRRQALEKIGGYPKQEMFEDYELCKRLAKIGKIQIRKEKAKVSGRRMQQRPLYYFVMMNLLPFLYRMGISCSVLQKMYAQKKPST